MRSYKKHKFFNFELDDGAIVKYDLSNGETIGKTGVVVKSLNTQLRGYDLYDVIESFEDENYKQFLKFVNKYFINCSTDRCYNRGDVVVKKVSNIGTFLSKLERYSIFEQYFAAGIYNVDWRLRITLKEIPKNLIKLCKEYNLTLDNTLIATYNKDPNLFNNLISIDYVTISISEIVKLLEDMHGSQYSYSSGASFKILITNYNYNPTSLMKYVDSLVTYEALKMSDIIPELKDYCNMMAKISNKFEKYPKNFLTTHRIAIRNYERLKEKFDEQKFKDVMDKSLEYKTDAYVFKYPETIQDIKDEAAQQSNCVASYIRSVLDGHCHILFLRNTDNIKNSLVTVEVRDRKAVQYKGKFNRDVTTEERNVINKYNKFLNNQNIMEEMTC
jgi:hypothetical protein